MNILFLCLIEYLFIISINTSCPNDEDLQDHQCICDAIHSYIQCSSLPNRCRTCYRYKAIYFDEKVDSLPAEAFEFYQFFDNDKKNLFKIQFAQLKNISTRSFSKININRERTLEIKILKYSSSIIPTRVFEDAIIETQSTLNIEIFNVTKSILTVEQYAFHGIKFNRQSQFRLSILSARDSIEFESNAGSIRLPSYAYMELYFTNFVRLLYNRHSFQHLTQEEFSELIINFDQFQSARFLHHSFSNFHQFDQSRFHFSLSNFRHLITEQTFFDTVTQYQSLLIISIYNLTNNLCLSNQTFSQIKQQKNSTFQFEIHSGQNILLNSESFSNITQNFQSKFLISITNSYDVYFSRYSLNNFRQENRSFIDISIKRGQNLIFEDYAIDTDRSGILSIGFQDSRGTLQMAINAFSNINEGQLQFQIINSSDFYFRFNQSISLQRLEILDRWLSSEDLCRIYNIPSHIPVQLLSDNPCSCTVYYLYRQLLPSIPTPLCYMNMSRNEIESAEIACAFENQIYNCQQMEGEIQINIPQRICQNEFKSNNPKTNNTFIFFLIIFGCLIFGIIICIYFSSSSNLFSKYFHPSQRQRLPIFSADSYQQLTQINQQESRRQIGVTYNSTTEQTQPYLDIEDLTLKLNTNPMSDNNLHSHVSCLP